MSQSFARRLFLKLIGSATVAAGSATVASGCGGDDAQSDSDNLTDSTFEYIVIGSGAGGGPLASNLARNGHKVLLLEAGEDKGNTLNYQVPAFHPLSTEDPTMRWDYFVKHYSDPERQKLDSKLTPEGVLYPRAGTLGGCTSHNAMITVYPHASDFEHIADLTGDESWRADAMRRYFEILEKCEYLGSFDNRDGHGFKGWLATNRADTTLALGDLKLLTIIQAAAITFAESIGKTIFGSVKELVGLMKRDLNEYVEDRDNREGLYTIPMATHGGKRNGPREYILKTVDDGHPLVVRTNALVSRIVFDTKKDVNGNLKATGVEYLEGGHLYRADPNADPNAKGVKKKVKATRDVIVSAGTFNTPQLLKLSGIGPKDELDALGIDVKVDLPGVGKNLQDRYEVGIIHEVQSDFSILKGCTFGADIGGQEDPCLTKWKNGSGVYTSNGGTVAIVKKSSEDKEDPDLFIFGLPGAFKGYEPGYSKAITKDKQHFTWAVLKGHTKNTAGDVTLRSADPRDVPEINFRYFDEGSTDEGQDQDDLDSVVAGVQIIRDIAGKTDFLMPFGKFEEAFPGPEVETPEQIATFVKNEAWGHHASCTCKIGAADDPTAVLDSEFRVRGTSNLRVVDASVFPRIPGFFIVTSIYMISEKATDVLLAELGEDRHA